MATQRVVVYVLCVRLHVGTSMYMLVVVCCTVYVVHYFIHVYMYKHTHIHTTVHAYAIYIYRCT